MKNKTTKIVIAGAVILVLCGLIGTCVAGKPSDPASPSMSTVDPNTVFTQVAGTIMAAVTQTAQANVTPTPEVTPTPKATPTPEATLTPTLEAQFIQATAIQSTQDYKNSFKEIDYRELVNYPDNHIGEMVIARGTVFNIIDDQNFQMWFSGTYDNLYVMTESKYTGLYENDVITVYGLVYGKTCGTNAYGAEVCSPALISAFFNK